MPAEVERARRLFTREDWLVDATAELIEIHRGPGPGDYGETRRLTGGATVSPQAFPDMTLPLTEIFA